MVDNYTDARNPLARLRIQLLRTSSILASKRLRWEWTGNASNAYYLPALRTDVAGRTEWAGAHT